MKKLLLLSLLISFSIFAQKKKQNLDSYTASNGVTYNVGDDITLNKGSDTNGDFAYFKIGGWMGGAEVEPMGSQNAGLIVTIKKIIVVRVKNQINCQSTVFAGIFEVLNYRPLAFEK